MSFSHAKRARRLKRDKPRRNKIKQKRKAEKRYKNANFNDPIDRTIKGNFGV